MLVLGTSMRSRVTTCIISRPADQCSSVVERAETARTDSVINGISRVNYTLGLYSMACRSSFTSLLKGYYIYGLPVCTLWAMWDMLDPHLYRCSIAPSRHICISYEVMVPAKSDNAETRLRSSSDRFHHLTTSTTQSTVMQLMLIAHHCRKLISGSFPRVYKRMIP